MNLQIYGQFVVGEALQAFSTEWSSGFSGTWEVQMPGSTTWSSLGIGTPTFVVPEWAAGCSFRVTVFADGETISSPATPVIEIESKHKHAPEFTGWDADLLFLIGEPGPVTAERLFKSATFSDPDKSSYRDGSLLVLGSDSVSAGGGGRDVLSVGTGWFQTGQLSFDAATGDITFVSRSGDSAVVGVIDSALDGAGDDLLIRLTKHASTDAINALVDSISFYNADGSSIGDRLLTLRVTDSDGLASQIVARIPPLLNLEESPPPPVESGVATGEPPVFVVGSVVLDPP